MKFSSYLLLLLLIIYPSTGNAYILYDLICHSFHFIKCKSANSVSSVSQKEGVHPSQHQLPFHSVPVITGDYARALVHRTKTFPLQISPVLKKETGKCS